MMLGRAAAAARRRSGSGTIRVQAAELPLRRIYQRSGTSAAVPVSGTYTGAAGIISARIINAASSVQVLGWTQVYSPPTAVNEFSTEFTTEFASSGGSGGASDFSSDFSLDFGTPGGEAEPSGSWSGTLFVPQGGWYKIQYRIETEQAAVLTANNTFGVGDIWMFAGQSQQARMSTLVTSAPTPDDLSGYFNGASGWALPGAVAGTGGNGVIRFLNTMITATGVPQACIQVSVEGTAITAWAPGQSAYNTATSRLSSVGAVAGVLWHQGGTGIGTISRQDYKTRLAAIFSGFSAAATVQRFGIFPLMHRTNAGDSDADTQDTRKAHYEYLAENPATINLGWLPDVPMADDVHQTAAGSELIAYTYAHALLYAMGIEPSNNLGPVITSATRSGTAVALNITQRSGTALRTKNNVTPTGFQVFARGSTHADAAALSISGISLAASTVTISLASDPASALDVYYQWGRFDNTAPVFDNTSALGLGLSAAMQPLMTPVQTPIESGQVANPALRFDNSTGHIRYGSTLSIWAFPDADWTIGFFASINNPAGTTSQYFFSTGSYGALNSVNVLIYEAGNTGAVPPGTVEVNLRGAGTAIAVRGAANTAFLDTAWRLWTIERVKASETLNIYYTTVNGTRTLYHSASVSGLGSIAPTVIPGLATRVPPISTSERWLDGNLYNFFKMNGTLTAAETQQIAGGVDLVSGLNKSPAIYNKLNTLTTPIPNSGTGGELPANVIGGVTLTAGPQFAVTTTAVKFDPAGLMTYTMPDTTSFNMPSGDWSISFMVSIDDNAGSFGQYLWSTGAYFAAECINILFWESSSTNPDKFGVALDDGVASLDVEIISTSTITSSIGTGYYLWTVEHDAATGRINIYRTPVNGERVLFHSHVLSSVLTAIWPPTSVMTIGGRNAAATPANRYFGGSMYLAFQMDGRLTQEQTQNIARGKDPALDLGLSLKWYHKFTSTSATRTDLSGNGNTATLTAGTPTLVAGPTFFPGTAPPPPGLGDEFTDEFTQEFT